MSLSTLRDSSATTMLVDQYSFSSWYKSLEKRCISLGVWDIIDPDHTTTPMTEPDVPSMPEVSNYAPREAAPSLSTSGRALRNRTVSAQPLDPTLNTTPSPEIIRQATYREDLSEAGLKAYDRDLEIYKITLEVYKIRERKYREERANLDKVTAIIQSSISTHLFDTCCISRQSLREWVTNLKMRMGTTTAKEREIARKRYREALKPMRAPNNWDTWLLEYDEASTEAELKGVGDFSDPEGVFRDFLDSVRKVAQNWADNFKQNQLNQPGMTRKEMMKRFREQMSDDYPKKTTQHHRGAFAVGGEEHSHDRSSLAAGGASTPGSNDRDASHAAKGAPSTPSNDSTRGSRKNQQRQTTGQRASSKRPRGESVQTDGAKCPACNGPHPLSRCFYINKDQAPEWFKPRPEMEAMVSKLLDLDLDLQAQVRALKRTQKRTSATKVSQTSEASTE